MFRLKVAGFTLVKAGCENVPILACDDRTGQLFDTGEKGRTCGFAIGDGGIDPIQLLAQDCKRLAEQKRAEYERKDAEAKKKATAAAARTSNAITSLSAQARIDSEVKKVGGIAKYQAMVNKAGGIAQFHFLVDEAGGIDKYLQNIQKKQLLQIFAVLGILVLAAILYKKYNK